MYGGGQAGQSLLIQEPHGPQLLMFPVGRHKRLGLSPRWDMGAQQEPSQWFLTHSLDDVSHKLGHLVLSDWTNKSVAGRTGA